MKRNKLYYLISSLLLVNINLVAQHTDANIFGDVQSNGEHVPFVNIYIEGSTIGTTTDHTGHYMLIDLPVGEQVIVAKSLGYKISKQTITLEEGKTIEVNFELEEETMTLHEVVVTGTKTFKRSTESPVIVNVLDNKTIENVQACNISEGLRFQPGLRVETDCQTCNYTQLRMNGLGGSYSQILINGRPIFSPLIGLYGMEQIPANMVERIEVVRGGASALYGSSAIGGTVNVITKIPNSNTYDIGFTTQLINGEATDNVLNGNISMVNQKRNAGAVLFVNRRIREAYDHTGITYFTDGTTLSEKDGYSELPELRNNSFGANVFYRPTPNQKIEANFSSLYEYRYGGEISRNDAHLAQQSEERMHNIFMGGVDYQLNFNNDNSSVIAYAAGQYTDRDHYTGLFPDQEANENDSAFQIRREEHLITPPYGYTENTTFQTGVQFNHRLTGFITGTNILTLGGEYVYDDVLDSIPYYQYGTNQTTKNTAVFAQSDWSLNKNITFLAGLRLDKHNLVDYPILSPRVSVLYKLKDFTQFRLTWGTGFRAPQAFDSDMHIAFAGGGISRISLDRELEEERSNSLSGSVNYDKATENFIAGFTIEGFYTKLKKAFYLHPVGEDELGEQFEKRNGPGAKVQGATLELRANYQRKAQLETGITIQSSEHVEAVDYIDGLEQKRTFLRTPNTYGYAILTLMPTKEINIAFSSIYTGSMVHAYFAPIPQFNDEFRTSPSFNEINLKIAYTIPVKQVDSGIEIFGGIKNITNAYQDDFVNFKNRDSNYIYGPAVPRTYYLGVKVKSF